MDVDAVLNKFFSDPKISFYLSLLKTEKWATLKENEKRKFFTRFNAAFCEFLDIKEIVLIFDSIGIKNGELEDNSSYNNIIVNDKNNFIINDINYNQYLTLYEYFLRVREEIQKLVCFTDMGDNFNSKLKAMWNKNFDSTEFGNILIDFYIDEEDYLYEYQAVKIDASKYAEKLLLEIVKRNFDIEGNSYDEQYFMRNEDILVNKRIVNIGINLLEENINENEVFKRQILNIKDKVDMLINCNLNEVDDEILTLAIHPKVSDVIGSKKLVKVYKELLSRVYDNDMDIRFSKGKVVINGDPWKLKYFFDNHINIILYECIRDLDYRLRCNEEFLNSSKVRDLGLEEAIISFKKRWLYKTILKLDSMINILDLQTIGDQPLYRLVNKENLYENLKNSVNGKFPIKRWKN